MFPCLVLIRKKRYLIALKHAAGHIRTELGKVLKLRHIPSITFDKDTSLDYSMHIESLLNEIKRTKKKINTKDREHE